MKQIKFYQLENGKERFFFGKGYRIYCTIENNIVVILLYAGDKSNQQKDIKIAQSYLQNMKGNNYDRIK